MPSIPNRRPEAPANRTRGPLLTVGLLAGAAVVALLLVVSLFTGEYSILSHGDGAEMRQPLGISIVGGLLLSQLLTLYTTPVVYLYLDRWRLRRTRCAETAAGGKTP